MTAGSPACSDGCDREGRWHVLGCEKDPDFAPRTSRHFPEATGPVKPWVLALAERDELAPTVVYEALLRFIGSAEHTLGRDVAESLLQDLIVAQPNDPGVPM